MATSRTAPAIVEALCEHIFDGQAGEPLRLEIASWLTRSARFREFAGVHKDKIRKKLRNCTDDDSRNDVRFELRVAHLLLLDRRIQLAFEPQGARGGPDFLVTLSGERPFSLEVTRTRHAISAATQGGPLPGKLLQLPASIPNAVLICSGETGHGEADIEAATRALRSRADAKDEGFFQRKGFRDSRDFYQRYLRLGAVVVVGEVPANDGGPVRWTNRSARIAVPERALRACEVCLAADGGFGPAA